MIQGGVPTGTLRYSMQVSGKGLTLRSTLRMTVKGKPVVANESVQVDRTGYPLMKKLHVVSNGKTYDLEVSFTGSVAKASGSGPNGPISLTVPAPEGAPMEVGSAFWFVRDHPKRGVTARFAEFNTVKRDWEILTDTYMGDEVITIGARKVKAHKVKTIHGNEWLDDNGLPYRWEVTDSKPPLLYVRQ